MLSFFIAAASVAAAQAAASAPVLTLKDLPNTTVSYYEVTGKDGRAIEKSLKKAATDPATRQLQVVRTAWSIDTSFNQRTTNGVCTVTAVTTPFSATVKMPRHANEAILPAAVLADWRSYTSQLDADAAAKLAYVRNRLGEIEKSMVGKSCDAALVAGKAALAKINADGAAFVPTRTTAAAGKQETVEYNIND